MRTAIMLAAMLFIPAAAFSATIVVPDDYSTIQAAITAAVNGDTVLVRSGTYDENIDFLGKAITLTSESGPTVTVINGNQAGSVVACQNGEDKDTILDGFTITNGYTTYGGGMWNSQSSPTVTNCIFSGNSATWYGGGMYNYLNSSPTLIDCTFSENSASYSGGGMINFLDSSPTLTNCTFSGNTANENYGEGGGMFNNDCSPTLTHCTFSGNSALKYGGGMYNQGINSPTVTNCIFWNDSPSEIYNNGSSPTVTYSCVMGGYPGTGNIDSDPLFVDESKGDFHLTYISPCMGTGDNTAVTELTDFEGDPRICYGTVDMGADECFRHLYYTGNATPGGMIELKFIDVPGTSPVGFWVAFNVLGTPVPGAYGDWYLLPPMNGPIPLPAIPANGVQVLSGVLPTTPPGPYTLYLQAIMGTPLKLTNLCQMDVQ